jgi:hypothetical protein
MTPIFNEARKAMTDKSKRKNSERVLTRYDAGWKYRVCRWMRWSSIEQATFKVSPDTCLTHLMQLKHAEWTRPDTGTGYKYASSFEVFPLPGETGYEFQAKLSVAGGSIQSVNGLIIDDGSGYSCVTLRTYDQRPFLYVAIMTALLLYSLINPAAMTCVAASLVISLPLFVLSSFMQSNNSASFRIAAHLMQLPRVLALGQTELTPKQLRHIRRNIRKHDPYIR